MPSVLASVRQIIRMHQVARCRKCPADYDLLRRTLAYRYLGELVDEARPDL